MKKFIISILLLAYCLGSSVAQTNESNFKVLPGSDATNNAVFTIGDIHIDRESGVLATNSFQLFHDVGVAVRQVNFDNFKLYPNPTPNLLSIESDIKIGSLQVIDANGKVIIAKNEVSDIDLKNIDAGQYVLLINGKLTFRFIKI